MTSYNFDLTSDNGRYLGFADNPMTFKLKIATKDFPVDTTAQEVVVTVDINGNKYVYSSEAANSQVLQFDIHSAFKDEYNNMDMTPDSANSFTLIKGTVSAHLSYLNPKEFVKTNGKEVSLYNNIYALCGKVSDKEIITNGYPSHLQAVKAHKNKLSLRPGVPIVNVGDTFYTHSLDDNTIPSVITTKTTITASTIPNNFKIVNDANRQEFRFINSFGLIESVSCVCLEEFAVNISQVQHSISGSGRFVPDNYTKNISTHKDHYRMSSGFMDHNNLEWFCNEFLSSPRHWMRVKGTNKIVPISVKSKDNYVIYDKNTASLGEIEFEVTL